MADKIQWAGNTMPKSDDKHLGIMSLDHVKKARAFHQTARPFGGKDYAAVIEISWSTPNS